MKCLFSAGVVSSELQANYKKPNYTKIEQARLFISPKRLRIKNDM